METRRGGRASRDARRGVVGCRIWDLRSGRSVGRVKGEESAGVDRARTTRRERVHLRVGERPTPHSDGREPRMQVFNIRVSRKDVDGAGKWARCLGVQVVPALGREVGVARRPRGCRRWVGGHVVGTHLGEAAPLHHLAHAVAIRDVAICEAWAPVDDVRPKVVVLSCIAQRVEPHANCGDIADARNCDELGGRCAGTWKHIARCARRIGRLRGVGRRRRG